MMPDDKTLHELRGAARRLAIEAGQKIMTIYEADYAVSMKEDRTPLTTADLASHRLIVEGLSQLAPSYPILSEESDQIPFTERARWQTYWLIDPLDGTREFINRNGEFTVNIALIHEHEAVLGVVYAPALGLCYHAGRGQGAYKDDAQGDPQAIRVRKLGTRKPTIAGSRSFATDALHDFLKKVGDHQLISMGSALKFCLVAEGTADLYVRLGLTSEWDTAAAHCVVEQAGGRLTRTDMSPLRYNTKESLLNPDFFVMGAQAPDWSRYLATSEPT